MFVLWLYFQLEFGSIWNLHVREIIKSLNLFYCGLHYLSKRPFNNELLVVTLEISKEYIFNIKEKKKKLKKIKFDQIVKKKIEFFLLKIQIKKWYLALYFLCYLSFLHFFSGVCSQSSILLLLVTFPSTVMCMLHWISRTGSNDLKTTEYYNTGNKWINLLNQTREFIYLFIYMGG